jgi:hypothetical protein
MSIIRVSDDLGRGVAGELPRASDYIAASLDALTAYRESIMVVLENGARMIPWGYYA